MFRCCTGPSECRTAFSYRFCLNGRYTRTRSCVCRGGDSIRNVMRHLCRHLLFSFFFFCWMKDASQPPSAGQLIAAAEEKGAMSTARVAAVQNRAKTLRQRKKRKYFVFVSGCLSRNVIMRSSFHSLRLYSKTGQ